MQSKSDNMPSKGNSSSRGRGNSRGRGRGNDNRNYQLRFCKTQINRKSDEIEGIYQSRKENPQKLTQLNSRFHPRHLVGKRRAQKDTIIDITSDSQVNSNFPNRWSPASLTFNNYFYLFLYLYIT